MLIMFLLVTGGEKNTPAEVEFKEVKQDSGENFMVIPPMDLNPPEELLLLPHYHLLLSKAHQ